MHPSPDESCHAASETPGRAWDSPQSHRQHCHRPPPVPLSSTSLQPLVFAPPDVLTRPTLPISPFSRQPCLFPFQSPVPGFPFRDALQHGCAASYYVSFPKEGVLIPRKRRCNFFYREVCLKREREKKSIPDHFVHHHADHAHVASMISKMISPAVLSRGPRQLYLAY